jgi:hypothetical protein
MCRPIPSTADRRRVRVDVVDDDTQWVPARACSWTERTSPRGSRLLAAGAVSRYELVPVAGGPTVLPWIELLTGHVLRSA